MLPPYVGGGTVVHRIGISIDAEGLKHVRALQKRFGVRSRSELFRELVRRYESLEREWSDLNRCVQGYLAEPERPGAASRAILKAALKGHAAEDWS